MQLPMPALDLVVIGVTVISAILAMVRGATREILTILAWVVAGFAAYFLFPSVLPYVQKHITNEKAALIAAIAGVFLLTLLVVSLITIKISDIVLDSQIGALDRTLGFVFGIVRGLFLCVLGWIILSWFLQGPPPAWIQDARTRPMLESSGKYVETTIKAVLPDYVMGLLTNTKTPKNDGTGDQENQIAPGNTPPAQPQ